MKKNLNEAGIMNELRGGSAFFPTPANEEKLPSSNAPGEMPDESETKGEQPSPIEPSEPPREPKPKSCDTLTPRHHDTVIPRHRDTTVSRNQDELIETIRKAVKHLGKEGATYRFTEEEKRRLANLVFTYRNQGIRTSENEITRVAINYVFEDYEENGRNSILAEVIERLNE